MEIGSADAMGIQLQAKVSDYLDLVMTTLMQASQAQVDRTDYDMVDYLNELVDICRAKDIAVIYDLVKIGVNISQDHLKDYPSPDIVTLGKALGGGYPIGAVGMTSTFKDLVVDRKVGLVFVCT